MDKIRVQSDIKKISVNDKGDYICINLKDQSFINRLMDLHQLISSEETSKYLENDGSSDVEMLKKASELNQKMLDEIDSLFGKGACKKIFYETYEENKDAMPGFMLIIDFLEQIMPLMEKYVKEFKNSSKLQGYLQQVGK